jgi:hypothetical protein
LTNRAHFNPAQATIKKPEPFGSGFRLLTKPKRGLFRKKEPSLY